MKKKKVLFLYTELAAYTIACFQKLSELGLEIHVIRYPVNKEAPFNFDKHNSIHFYERSALDISGISELIKRIEPSLIVCSGWIDKDYISVCKKHYEKITTVVAFDNKWKGSWRQLLASVGGKFTISKYFHFAWVPGEVQAKYAAKLGFNKDKIVKGFYSCDQTYFNSYFEKFKNEKAVHFPHRFIFVGRYYDFKGVTELWKAFVELKLEFDNDWELWCLGKGDIDPVQHLSIKHFGFVQPNEIEKFMKETGVFVLPSRTEPWGVALHEFSAAGFPLLCSDEVGAAETFLNEKENGFTFCTNDKNDLKAKLKQFISMSDVELNRMGSKSNELSKKITTTTWADSALEMIK